MGWRLGLILWLRSSRLRQLTPRRRYRARRGSLRLSLRFGRGLRLGLWLGLRLRLWRVLRLHSLGRRPCGRLLGLILRLRHA